jgi:hypothetical protein
LSIVVKLKYLSWPYPNWASCPAAPMILHPFCFELYIHNVSMTSSRAFKDNAMLCFTWRNFVSCRVECISMHSKAPALTLDTILLNGALDMPWLVWTSRTSQLNGCLPIFRADDNPIDPKEICSSERS